MGIESLEEHHRLTLGNGVNALADEKCLSLNVVSDLPVKCLGAICDQDLWQAWQLQGAPLNGL